MKIILTGLFTLFFSLISIASYAEQANKNSQSKVAKPSASYVIESQVQGSQEQPKVIYITPWQELNSTVNIVDANLAIRLPKFKPIHPKKFKRQVSEYYQTNKTK